MLDQKLGLDETLNSQRWTLARNFLENKFSKFTPTGRSRRRRFQAFPSGAHAQQGLSSGAIIVLDTGAPHGFGPGQIFVVDRFTGIRSVFSDLSDQTQGPVGGGCGTGIASDASGNVYFTDHCSAYLFATHGPALFKVDGITGFRTIVSDFANAAQGEVGYPYAVVLDGSGNLIVAANLHGPTAAGRNVLLKIDPSTGMRSIISDSTDSAEGPQFNLKAAVLESSGSILVLGNGGTLSYGALIRVDSSTGMRTPISDFGNSAEGPLVGRCPSGLALDSYNKAYLTDLCNSPGSVFTVDISTGVHALLSDLSDTSQGPQGESPDSIAVDTSGSVFVTSEGPLFGPAGILAVNRLDGTRSRTSNFLDPAQGPLGFSPKAITILRSTAGISLNGHLPSGIAVDPDANKIYVANKGSHDVSVIDGSKDTLLGQPIPVGPSPIALAVNTVTHKIYVSNSGDSTISVIDGSTMTVTGKIQIPFSFADP